MDLANEGTSRSANGFCPGSQGLGGNAADEMIGRAEAYRTLGRLFFQPLSDDELAAMDADRFRLLSEGACCELAAEGYNDMYRFLRRRNTATCQDLRADFTQVFCGVREYKGVSAVPYESIYLHPEGELMGPARLEVFRTYKRHCVKLSAGVDIPEDHIAFELEFMAVLSERCAEALRSGDVQRAFEQIDAQVSFLDQHVLRWFDRFFNLANKLVETRFYRGVLKVTKGFLEDDRAALARWRLSGSVDAPTASSCA